MTTNFETVSRLVSPLDKTNDDDATFTYGKNCVNWNGLTVSRLSARLLARSPSREFLTSKFVSSRPSYVVGEFSDVGEGWRSATFSLKNVLRILS